MFTRLVNLESSWDPSKRNPNSGAAGLGAVLPSTAARPGFGVPPLPPGATPQEQLNFSAQYLAARGKAAGLTAADWKDPQKVSVALAAYHGPATDANGVNGQNYAQRIMGMSGSATDAATALGAQPNAAAALGIQSPYGPAMVQSTIAQMEAAQRDKEQRTAPIYDEMVKNYRQDQARFEKMADSYHPVQPIPQPVPPENDPMKGFGSAAGMFAMLASAFTHTPAVNAMNGMAAAINATRDGDQQAYQNAMTQWKTNTEMAIQNHKLQADDMKAAMDMMKDDLSAGKAMAETVAAQSQDQIGLAQIKLGAWDKLAEHQQAMQAAALNMQEKLPDAMTKMALLNAQTQMAAAQKSGDPAAISTAQENLERAEIARHAMSGNTSAADRPGSAPYVTKQIYDQIKRDHPEISDGDAWAQATTRQRSAERQDTTRPGSPPYVTQQIFNQIKKDHPEISDAAAWEQATERQRSAGKMDTAYGAREKDAEALALDEFKKQHGRDPGPGDNAEMATLRTQQRAEFQGQTTAERTLGNRTVNLAMASSELNQFGPMAVDASEKVDRTKYRTLNSLVEAVEQGTGDENVTRLVIAINGVKTAYAQVLVRNGVTTDDARRRSDEVIDKAWSTGQIKVAIDQMQQETAAAQRAPGAARAELRGMNGGGQAPAGGTASAGGNAPVVSSKAAYDALPPGSPFRKPGDPPDQVRIKQ